MRKFLFALILAPLLGGCTITAAQLQGDWAAAVAIFERVKMGEKIVADHIRASITIICLDRANINAQAIQIGTFVTNAKAVRALNESLATYNAMCDSAASGGNLIVIARAGYAAYQTAKAQLRAAQVAVR